MALSPTATRILRSLPSYHWDNPIIIRIVQARANEIDRMDGMIDSLKEGLIPAAGDDSLKLLSVWEVILGLPVAPAGVTVGQRQTAIIVALKRLNAVTATDVLDLLAVQVGAAFSISRDTPALLEDTLTLHVLEGTYTSGLVQRAVQRVWPAHRLLNVTYDAGFVLDTSDLDLDSI